MATWTPQAGKISSITELLQKGTSGDPAHIATATSQMAEWEKDVEFVNHLAYMFTHCPPEHAGILPVAGATLSGCLARVGSGFENDQLAVIKGLILGGVGSGDDQVSKFSCNSVSCLMRVLAKREAIARQSLAKDTELPPSQQAWPELLPALASGFVSTTPAVQMVTLRLTAQLFEDVPSWFANQGVAVTDGIVARVMAVAKAQPAGSLEHAAKIIANVCLFAPESFPTSIKASVSDWISLLRAAVSNHGNPMVRKRAIDALGKLMCATSRECAPHLKTLVDTAVAAASDPNPMVAAEAICFWEIYPDFIRQLKPAKLGDAPGSPASAAAVSKADVRTTYLRPLFPVIIPLLVQKLRITDLDAADLPVEDDSAAAAAVPAGKPAGAGAGPTTGWSADEGDNGLGFVSSGEYTPRKAATGVLQELAIYAGDDFAEALWPFVCSLLTSAPPAGLADWESKEIGLVILDATVTYCRDFYKSTLPPLSAGLCSLATMSPRPLVRRGALAVLGKMASISASMMTDDAITPVLAALGRGMTDKSEEPQAAAFRALANVFRELDYMQRVQPAWLTSAANVAVSAMPTMSLRGRRAATNLLHAVAESGDGSHFTPELTASVLGATVGWWEQRRSRATSVLDGSIQIAIECTTTVVEASHRAAEPFAARILGLCSELAIAANEMEMGAYAAGEASNGLTNAARAMDLAGTFLSLAVPTSAAAAWLKSQPMLASVASTMQHSEDLELLEACVGFLGETVNIVPAEVMATLLPLWPQLVAMLHPDYQMAAVQSAWGLSRFIDSLGSALNPGLPQLMERVFDLIRGRYATFPDEKGTGLSAAFNANLALLLSSVSKAAPALVHKAVEAPKVMANWLACATFNSDAAEKIQIATAIVKCLMAVPASCSGEDVVMTGFVLTSSFATVTLSTEQATTVRTVCSTLVHVLRSNVDDVTWVREAARTNNATVRGRVNAIVGSVVLPIGESSPDL